MMEICDQSNVGNEIYALASQLWPLNRSLTGNGVRETLNIIKETLPALRVYEVPSGTQVFDWVVPNEWNVREAWIKGPNGEVVADFGVNNLHLVGYSTPVNLKMSLDELQKHLHSLPEQPSAIPYITSYYSPYWGFCLRDLDRKRLKEGEYQVCIDATLEPGFLTYGELFIQGETSEEILLSTYTCHPSMANNELSGLAVTTHLAKWLCNQPGLKYSYRILFIPETIGSITYLSQNLSHLKRHMIAGFNVSCVGDDRNYSYLPSRDGDTLSDRVALHVLKHIDAGFKRYTWLDRGSDERQYCAPGIDLPVATIMRTKYGEYPEYHTSLDDLKLISPQGLAGGYGALQRVIETIEKNCYPIVTVLGEPQLGKRGLYPNLSRKNSDAQVRNMMNLISYCDGKHSLLEIAEIIQQPFWELSPFVELLLEHGLLKAQRTIGGVA